MKKVELLSPVGNRECFDAAIRAGCDAVYLGGYLFGARSYAGNFSNEELEEVVKIAHIHGVRVYVTVNTIVYESETQMFFDYVDFLYRINVDALIIQDLGMMDAIHQMYPDFELHASTQMHAHNLECVQVLEEEGLSRVVLARETSIDQIQNIRKNTKVELEIFVHGALCISYSGQCLMSKMIGGRSGNRGTCAGSCRLPYELLDHTREKRVNKEDYVLSMKDLNALEHLQELLEIGVDSLKIEGRMKRPEYVYLVTSIYRKAIDSFYASGKVQVTEQDQKELKKIYHRYFTKGFLFHKDNQKITNEYRPNHMGIPIGKVIQKKKNKVVIQLSDSIHIQDGIRIVGKEDVGFTINQFYIGNRLVKEAFKGDTITVEVKHGQAIEVGSKVMKTTDVKQIETIQKAMKEYIRRIPIEGKLVGKIGTPLTLQIDDGKHQIQVQSKANLEKAKTEPLTVEQIKKQLNRLKDTCYEWKKLDIEVEPDSFMTMGVLNQLRREGMEQLNEKRIGKREGQKQEYVGTCPEVPITNNHTVQIQTEQQYQEVKGKYDTIYVDDFSLYQKLSSDPKVIYRLERAGTHYPPMKTALITELGGLGKYQNTISDTSFNVVNSYTLAFLYHHGVKRVTLSYELEENQIEEMIQAFQKRYHFSPNVEVVIDSYPEILISKFDLLKKYHLSTPAYLKDRKGAYYKVTNNHGLTHIYHSDKIILNEKRLREIGVTNFCIHK